MTDEKNLEEQVVIFNAPSDHDDVPIEGRLNRKRGRPSHSPSDPIRQTHRTNNKIHRDIERNVKANKGNDDLMPWAQNAFCLPSGVQERFEEAGYYLLFCPLDDMSIREKENLGWVGVTLEEVPEWLVSSIPSVSQHSDIYKRFVVCIDQILLKIDIETHNRIKARIDGERRMNNAIVKKARQNSMNPYAMNQSNVLDLKR
jgi:hypothetical protein